MSNRSRELERTYESHLQEQLRAMRTEFDARLSENRQEIDEIYKVDRIYLWKVHLCIVRAEF